MQINRGAEVVGRDDVCEANADIAVGRDINADWVPVAVAHHVEQVARHDTAVRIIKVYLYVDGVAVTTGDGVDAVVLVASDVEALS